MASNKIHLGNTKIVSDAEAPEGTIIATPTKSGTIALLSDVGEGASPVDTYTKTEIDAQQSKQNHDIAENHADIQTNSNRITKNEEDIAALEARPNGGETVDAYTKAEVDAQQDLQDIEIAKNAEAISNIPAPINTYSKDQIDSQQQAQDDVTATKANKIDVYTKAEVDASQNEQDAEIVKKADKKDVIEDAPTDGETYARNNETWVSISETSGIPDAPVDGKMYGRKDGEWDAVADAGDIYTKTEIDSQQSAQDTKIDKNKSDIAKNTADIAAIPAPVDSYTKAEVDASQEAQNTEIDKKADKETTYTKAQIDSQQSAQDTKIDKNIDDIQTNADAIAAIPAPIDSYTKAEVDASQNEQDTEILKKADKANVYTKTEMDTQQSAQDTKIDKNVSDVAKNTADITKYTADVAKNTSDIAQNTADIAKNTADIEAMPPYVDAYTKTETNTLLDGKADKGSCGGGSTPEALVWENVIAERAISTEYTNTNDVPLYVTIAHSGGGSANFSIDGNTIGRAGSSEGGYYTETYVVPANSVYKFNLYTGTVNLQFWHEARMPLAIAVGEASSGGGGTTDVLPVLYSGTINQDGTVNEGTGFTCEKTATGKYVVTLDKAVIDTSSIVVTGNQSEGRNCNTNLDIVSDPTTQFGIVVKSMANNFVDSTLSFTVTGTEPIAVGGGSGGSGDAVAESWTPHDYLYVKNTDPSSPQAPLPGQVYFIGEGGPLADENYSSIRGALVSKLDQDGRELPFPNMDGFSPEINISSPNGKGRFYINSAIDSDDWDPLGGEETYYTLEFVNPLDTQYNTITEGTIAEGEIAQVTMPDEGYGVDWIAKDITSPDHGSNPSVTIPYAEVAYHNINLNGLFVGMTPADGPYNDVSNIMIGQKPHPETRVSEEYIPGIYWNPYSTRDNITIGNKIFRSIRYGTDNIAIGSQSFGTLINGSCNTLLGQYAGFGMTSGDNNIIIGHAAEPKLGLAVDEEDGVVNNQVVLGDDQMETLFLGKHQIFPFPESLGGDSGGGSVGGSGGIEEAPEDNRQYARQNGGWSEVVSFPEPNGNNTDAWGRKCGATSDNSWTRVREIVPQWHNFKGAFHSWNDDDPALSTITMNSLMYSSTTELKISGATLPTPTHANGNDFMTVMRTLKVGDSIEVRTTHYKKNTNHLGGGLMEITAITDHGTWMQIYVNANDKLAGSIEPGDGVAVIIPGDDKSPLNVEEVYKNNITIEDDTLNRRSALNVKTKINPIINDNRLVHTTLTCDNDAGGNMFGVVGTTTADGFKIITNGEQRVTVNRTGHVDFGGAHPDSRIATFANTGHIHFYRLSDASKDSITGEPATPNLYIDGQGSLRRSTSAVDWTEEDNQATYSGEGLYLNTTRSNQGITVDEGGQGGLKTILFNSSSTYGTVGTTTNNAFRIITNNSPRMTIGTDGRVDITGSLYVNNAPKSLDVMVTNLEKDVKLKDKLIEKLSKRLDKLEARMKK